DLEQVVAALGETLDGRVRAVGVARRDQELVLAVQRAGPVGSFAQHGVAVPGEQALKARLTIESHGSFPPVGSLALGRGLARLPRCTARFADPVAVAVRDAPSCQDVPP